MLIVAVVALTLSHPAQVLDIVQKCLGRESNPRPAVTSATKSLALELALASCCQESPLGYPSVATWSSGQHYCRATPPARVARLGGFVRPRVVYLETHYCGFHPHATESNPSHWKGRCQFILASAFPSVFNCIAALLQFHCAHEKLAVVALQQSFAASGALVIYIYYCKLYILLLRPYRPAAEKFCAK